MDNSGKLTLTTGRVACLVNLRQTLTYSGWLEGYPTTEDNRHLLEELRGPDEPYLIEPVEKVWGDECYGPRKPAFLPAVTCRAEFESTKLERDPDGYASVLPVTWFQDQFAFPIDPLVLERLVALDWEGRATDWEY